MTYRALFLNLFVSVTALSIAFFATCSNPTVPKTGPAKLTLINNSSDSLKAVSWNGFAFGTIQPDTSMVKSVRGSTASELLIFDRHSRECAINLSVLPGDSLVFVFQDSTPCFFPNTGVATLTLINSSSNTLGTVSWEGFSFGTMKPDTSIIRSVQGNTASELLVFYRQSQECLINLIVLPGDSMVFTIQDTTSCYYYK